MAGRPNKYETHVLPRLDEIRDWCRNGATDKVIADRLNISLSTFSEYKKTFSEFSDVIKNTKDFADGQVENALFQNALKGNITAQIFWLKNRRPEKWRNRAKNFMETREPKLVEITFADISKEESEDG